MAWAMTCISFSPAKGGPPPGFITLRLRNPPPLLVPPQRLVVVPFCMEINKRKWILQTAFRIKLVFKYPNSLGSALIKNSPPLADHSAGVYRLPCRDCTEVYWGETSKPLRERLQQHRYALNRADPASAVYRHVLLQEHSIDWNFASTVFPTGDLGLRRLVESYLISTFPCFNLSEGFCKLDNELLRYVGSQLPPPLSINAGPHL